MHTTMQDTVDQAVWSQAAPKPARSLLSLANMEIASRRAIAKAQKASRRRRDTAASRWSLPQLSRLALPRPLSRWTLPQSWRAKPRTSAAGVALAGLFGALAAAYLVAPDRIDLALAYFLEPVSEFTAEPEDIVAEMDTAPALAPPPPLAPPATPGLAVPAPAAPVPAAPAPVAPVLAAPASTHNVTPARPPSRAPAAAQAAPATDEFADLFEDAPARMSELTAEAIVSGVKANAASGAHCLRQAVAQGEISQGSYKLVLDWSIRPDGTVSVAQVTGPAAMLRTSIAGCYGRAMLGWQFAASPRGAPVRNFPLSFSVK